MAACKHLLIDGYNIIHAWPDLHTVLVADLEAAVQRLCGAVRVIHDFEGVRTTIVLDGKSDEIAIERPSGQLSFSCLYTPHGVTADCLIEQLVGNARDPAAVRVATDDAMIRESVSAAGALALSSGGLLDWAEACGERQGEYLSRYRARHDNQWRTDRGVRGDGGKES